MNPSWAFVNFQDFGTQERFEYGRTKFSHKLKRL